MVFMEQKSQGNRTHLTAAFVRMPLILAGVEGTNHKDAGLAAVAALSSENHNSYGQVWA